MIGTPFATDSATVQERNEYLLEESPAVGKALTELGRVLVFGVVTDDHLFAVYVVCLDNSAETVQLEQSVVVMVALRVERQTRMATLQTVRTPRPGHLLHQPLGFSRFTVDEPS